MAKSNLSFSSHLNSSKLTRLNSLSVKHALQSTSLVYIPNTFILSNVSLNAFNHVPALYKSHLRQDFLYNKNHCIFVANYNQLTH